MNILFVTTTLPHRLTNGGEIATQSLIEGIRACGHDVAVLGYTRAGDPPADQPHFHNARDWPIETELAPVRRWLWLARSMLTRTPYVCVKFTTAAMRNAARSLCRTHRFDAAIIDHSQLAWLAEESFLPDRRIVVAHNVEHHILSVQASDPANTGLKHLILARDARLMRTVERKLIRDVEQVWVLTQEERDSLQQLGDLPDETLRTIPLPGQGFAPSSTLPEPDHDVVILGSWLWDVNRKGLEWFMAQVAPLLPERLKIAVGGKGSEHVPNPFPHIKYMGFVPDAADFLRSGKLICVPSAMGAGIQLKTIEGIGIGRPIVTTPVGLRGIGAVPDHVHVTADAAAMAQAIIAIAQAPTQDHSAQGCQWAQARQQAFTHAIATALQDLR